MVSLSPESITRSTSPLLVYFTAFIIRFIIIWNSLVSSLATIAPSGHRLALNSSPLSRILSPILAVICDIRSLRFTGPFLIEIWLFSISVKSSKSCMMNDRLSPDLFIILIIPASSSVIPFESIRPDMPIIPFSGVLSSWLRLARKRFFALFASSAAFFALSSSSFL